MTTHGYGEDRMDLGMSRSLITTGLINAQAWMDEWNREGSVC